MGVLEGEWEGGISSFFERRVGYLSGEGEPQPSSGTSARFSEIFEIYWSLSVLGRARTRTPLTTSRHTPHTKKLESLFSSRDFSRRFIRLCEKERRGKGKNFRLSLFFNQLEEEEEEEKEGKMNELIHFSLITGRRRGREDQLRTKNAPKIHKKGKRRNSKINK